MNRLTDKILETSNIVDSYQEGFLALGKLGDDIKYIYPV